MTPLSKLHDKGSFQRVDGFVASERYLLHSPHVSQKFPIQSLGARIIVEWKFDVPSVNIS